MSCRPFVVMSLSVLVALGSACSKATPPGAAQPAAATSPAPAGAAPGDSSGHTVSGPVLETMNASTYTYVRVHTDTGDIWAAANTFPVKVGDRVTVPLDMPMRDFRSQALNRTFPVIYFTSAIRNDSEPGAAASAQPAPAMPGPMASHGSTVGPEVSSPMTPPPGGISVAQLWKDRQTLAGKTVTVHGKVVKFNGGILGRNWLHLQDGTGEANKTDDLAITTPPDVVVQVGDTVTITGTVAIDKDFTAGYKYPVMLENGRLAGAS